jgi:predicted kinase
MRYLKIYSDFHINEEWSKNDPIPELNEDKLAIILMGTPGLGKSYFNKNYIQPRQEIKTFSTDDVSLMFTKDPNKYYPASSELNIKRLLTFMDTNQSFIYDTTGTHPDQVFRLVQKAKKQKYKVLFIHLIGTLEMSLKQNQMRDRQADPEYIEFSYKTQFPNMKTYFDQLKPDAYYLVYNKEGKYKFYKFSNGKLLKRKVDKYVEL